MAVQFEYPEKGWSTGKMRKKGEKLAMDWQRRGTPDTGGLADIERAAGFGMAARGGVFGTAQEAPSQVVGGQLTREVQSQIIQHKQQIQDGINQVAQGSMDMLGLNKLLKKLGWSREQKTGEYVDPTGAAHVIGPQAAEEQK